MESVAAHPPREIGEQQAPYRCARCGVESLERSCFVIPERFSARSGDTRCVTCEESHRSRVTAANLLTVLGALAWPFLIVIHRDGELTLPVMLFGILVSPVIVLLHELGHALTGRALGLEIGLISIGHGPIVRKLLVGQVPVHLHAFPLSGRVYLGAPSLHLLRTRVWLATLMGPMTNAILIVTAVFAWDALEPLTGEGPLAIWVVLNAIIVVGTLYPYRYQEAGQTYRSDGLALFELPRSKPDALRMYLLSAPLLRALARIDRGDYAGARSLAENARARDPDNIHPRILLSACASMLGQHAKTIALLRPIAAEAHESPVRAAIQNNIAFAVALSNVGAPADDPQLGEADRLSASAFALYPCLLHFRSTRALVLVAMQKPEQALALLEYTHYERAPASARSHREAVRAFALSRMDRHAEARAAAELAAQLDPTIELILRTLGIPRTSFHDAT